MASSEWKAEEGPVRLICAECGSDDLYGTAAVVWEEDGQLWEIDGHIATMHCRTCDRENVEVNKVQITGRPTPDEVPVFIRSKRVPGAFGFEGEGAA